MGGGGNPLLDQDQEHGLDPVSDTCALCGEGFTPETKGDGQAEMYDPADNTFEHTYIVHYDCGTQKGMLLA